MSKRRNRDKQRQPVPRSSSPADENVRQIARQEISTSSAFSGPLPPPHILVQYNEAVPNGAERIIAMAEKQANHRMTLESRVVDADIKRSNGGLVAGFIVALAGLAASFFMIDGGHEVAGVIVGTTDIVGLVGVFIYGTVSRRRERKERTQMMAGEP